MAITATEIIAEMTRCQAEHDAGRLPDVRKLATMMSEGEVNAPCVETGLTPLLWAVENDSLYVNLLMLRGADPAARGTGEHDVLPAERAVAKGLMQRAEQIARHGGPMPEALTAWREAARQRVLKYDGELKAITRTLEKGLKGDVFLAEANRLAAIFGVEAKKIRGRKGHLSFKAVPIRKLAKADGMSEEAWLARHQSDAAANGVSLLATTPPGEVAKDELWIAPDARQARGHRRLAPGLGRGRLTL